MSSIYLPRRLVLVAAILLATPSLFAVNQLSGQVIEKLSPIEGGYEIYVPGNARPFVIENAAEFSAEELKSLKAKYLSKDPVSLTVDGQTVVGLESFESGRPLVRQPVNGSAVTQLLALNQNRPFWTGDSAADSRVSRFLQLTQSLSNHGLKTTHYEFNKLVSQLDDTRISDADFEREFTREAIRLAQDIRSGRVLPENVAVDVKYKWKGFNDWATLHEVLTQLPVDAWDKLAPKNIYYLEAKKSLDHLQKAKADGLNFTALQPANVLLKLGSTHPVIKSIKETLIILGFDIQKVDANFTSDLSEALKKIQLSNLTDPNGELQPKDSATWEFFAHSLDGRILQAELTLEKTRWLPDTLPSRYILVNLARQRAQLADPELTMAHLADQKTINGRVDRKTPSMADRITQVVLNPTWTVPDGIFEKDKIPLLTKVFAKGGSPESVADYLGEHGYRLLTKDLKSEIDPTDIDWSTLTRETADFVIRQDARIDNALGLVKFHMTNDFNIYLHDTNERNLFASPYRLRSSGCIRVQHPIDLAQYALQGVPGWDRKRIDQTLATHDREGQQTRIPLARPISVFTISLTMHQQGNAVLFTRDMYRQNKNLLNVLLASGYPL